MEGKRKDITKVSKIDGRRGAEGLPRVAIRKMPAITAGFWLVAILAAMLGETGGAALSLSLDLGPTMGSVLFVEIFAAAVAAQVAVVRFHPFLFWSVIIATTPAGAALAGLLDRALGIGRSDGVGLLLALMAGTFVLWYRTAGSVSVGRVATPAAELFFWVAILLSQMLGTASSRWMVDHVGVGLQDSVVVGGALVILLGLYVWSPVSRTVLFWCAFVLIRPLGTALADWLDGPAVAGGLDLDRVPVSALLLAAILVCIAHSPRRPAR